MLLESNGIIVSFRKIKAEMEVKEEKDGGSHIEYAASFLADICQNPILFDFNPEIQPGWHTTAEMPEIADSLRELIKKRAKKKYRLKKLLQFLEQGGIYHPQPLSLVGLKSVIKSKRPVIVTLEPNHISIGNDRQAIEAMSHAVVVVGYTRNEIIFLDPEESANLIKVDKNLFLWAWYYDGGCALFI